jgi:hypothetical protein
MIMTNKLLPVALIAALVGGSVGAFVMSSRNEPTAIAGTQQAQAQTDDGLVPAEFTTPAEKTAYKSGFVDGFTVAARTAENNIENRAPATATRTRVVTRNVRTQAAPQRVYYDFHRRDNRSFWDKHRDKLTVAIGAGSGAAVGAIAGGKKGAGIGALAGGGGAALYTYLLRDRNKRR